MIEKCIGEADPVRFRLLARDDSDWENLLREHQLSISLLADRESALRIGKLLAAELLLVADVRLEGKGITIHARVLDVSTGQIMFVGDVYTEAVEDLDWVLSGLVLKIEQRFPMLEGRVLKTARSRVTLDLGERQGVRPGTRFIVLQAAEESSPGLPESVLRISETWVQLEADRITNEASSARIVPEAGASAVREGDRVYAR
jgi:hypothetical protein